MSKYNRNNNLRSSKFSSYSKNYGRSKERDRQKEFRDDGRRRVNDGRGHNLQQHQRRPYQQDDTDAHVSIKSDRQVVKRSRSGGSSDGARFRKHSVSRHGSFSHRRSVEIRSSSRERCTSYSVPPKEFVNENHFTSHYEDFYDETCINDNYVDYNFNTDYDGSAKSVYYIAKSDEDLPENGSYSTTLNNNSNHIEFYHESDRLRNKSNLSPISSVSSALQIGAAFDIAGDTEGRESYGVQPPFFYGPNDVDLRTQGRSHNPHDHQRQPHQQQQQTSTPLGLDAQSQCQYQSLGCRVSAKRSSISSHERDCLFNPKHVKSRCKTCKLIVDPEHDCIDELKEELYYIRKRTDWTKCSNSMRLPKSNDGYRRVWVHYFSSREEKVVNLHLSKDDNTRTILRKALSQLGLRSSTASDQQDYSNYQLAFSSFHVLPSSSTTASTSASTLTSFTVNFPSSSHFLLLPKLITVKISAKKLFYENEHIVVSVPSLVPLEVDPAATVADLKRVIYQKLPVDWSKHHLMHCSRELHDYMVLYTLGVLDGDNIEVSAV